MNYTTYQKNSRISAEKHFDLNKQIKQVRKQDRLTRVEFSLRSGVGLRFLREFEQGKPTVRLDKVNKILKFLGYHLELKKNKSELLKKV